jgi:hypothetical protein
MEKTYRFIPRYNPVWILVSVLGVMAIFILSTLKSVDPTGIAAAVIVIGFTAFSFYRSKSGLQRAMDRKLVLDETGLRYEISGQAYSLAWDQCDHRIERVGRDGEVRVVALVSRDGEWLTLNRFEDMPGIVATIRQHVPASGPRGLAEMALLLNRWPGFLLSGLALLGMYIFARSKQIIMLPADQSNLLAIVLVVPVILVSWYMWSRSPLMKLGRAVQQQGSGSAVRRFFINFAVWIVIVIVALLILNFFVTKPH